MTADSEAELDECPRGPLGPMLYKYGVTRMRLSDEQRSKIEEGLYDRARIGGPSTRNFLVLSVLSSTISALVPKSTSSTGW